MLAVVYASVRGNDISNTEYVQLEPRYEKTGFLHMRKQRRRSAAQ